MKVHSRKVFILRWFLFPVFTPRIQVPRHATPPRPGWLVALCRDSMWECCLSQSQRVGRTGAIICSLTRSIYQYHTPSLHSQSLGGNNSVFGGVGEGKGGRKRGRETSMCGRYIDLVASHMCPSGDLACNPGMYPDWEAKLATFWFAGLCSIHWATPPRNMLFYIRRI